MTVARLSWILSLAGAVLGLIAATASAADQVYWVNQDGESISHAGVNGGGGADVPITGVSVDHPQGLAIDSAAGRVYWVNREETSYSIRQANLDGSGGRVLNTIGAPVMDPVGLAIDPALGRIYWVNFAGNAVYFANLDGSGGGELDTTGAVVETPVGLAVYPAQNRIYWANFEESSHPIGYANLDGTGGGGSLDLTGAEVDMPEGIAIDPLANRVYWANRGSIGFASANGGEGGKVDTDGLPTEPPEGLAIDPFRKTIYWGETTADIIGVAGLDPGGPFGHVDTTGATHVDPVFPVLLEDPRNTGAPILSSTQVATGVLRRRVKGLPTVESQARNLSCTEGTWAGDVLESFLYRAPQTTSIQWLRNERPIAGAFGPTYSATEVGDYACRATAANAAGSSAKESDPVNIRASFALGRPAINRKKGTAKLPVAASGTGFVALSGKSVRARRLNLAAAGPIPFTGSLPVKARGGAGRRLRANGRAKVKAMVTYIPTGGVPLRATKRITLRLAAAG